MFTFSKANKQDGSYKGFTEDFMKRLQQHNNGESQYTSSKLPWKLVYVEEQPTKKDALIRERNLKKATRDRILHLISSEKNLLNNKIWHIAKT